MFKKLLSVFLCIVIVFNFASVVLAENDYSVEQIYLHNGLEKQTFSVIKFNDELYATADEINKIFKGHRNENGKERFVITENDINLVFKLGDKYVLFSKENKTITVSPVNFSQSYSGTIKHDGAYYYPLSEALPWMNVECNVDNGVLVVKPDIKSVWEISEEIRNTDLQFNIIDEMGDNTATAAFLIAANIMDGFFAVFNLDIDRLILVNDDFTESWHTVNNYYDCFTEMATDDFMVSEQAIKIIKNIKTVNKFDESIRVFFEMTSADVDMESILSGYETDKTKGAEYAEMCEQFKMASDLADLAKAIDTVLPVLKAIEATSHVMPGYFDALISQQNNANNSVAYQLALDRSVTALNGKLPAIFTAMTDFVLGAAFEELGSALEQDYSKIFFVEGFCSAVSVVENVLSLVWPVNKAASEVAQLPIFYDIQQTSLNTANKYKFEATSIENIHLMRVNYMLSLLASKKSYEAMKKVLSLIGEGELKSGDIERIEGKLVEIALAESAEENDVICDKSKEAAKIKEALKNVTKPAETKLQTNYDKYGKYIGKDFSFVLNDYPNAQKQTDGYWGREIIKLTDSVTLYYDEDENLIEYYHCTASDLFPNINSPNRIMTRIEFEKYSGVSTHFSAGEHHSDCLSTLGYSHQGYQIYIYSDFDGSINLDYATFVISKPKENDSRNNNYYDKTYYDRYGKYLREPFEFAFKAYAIQDAVKFDEYGLKIFQYNDVDLYYDETDICYKYECLAYELYPGLVYEKSSVSKNEFENYLGTKIGLENSDKNNSYLYYHHGGYYFEVTCKSDGTIVFGESKFVVILDEDAP